MTILTGKKPYFGLRGGWLVFWVTVACASDMTLFGYDQAVFSGVVVTQDFLVLHDLVGPGKTKVLSTVTAIYNVGCFIGAIIAFTIVQMFVGRIVLGVGNGINTTAAPIWQTETSKAQWRGKLVILEMMMNIAGFSLVNWINYGLSFRGGSIAWRFPLAFQFIFIFILWGTVPWLPESPRWLLAHNRKDEALQVLAALENKESTDSIVVTEFREIEFAVEYEREHVVSWHHLFMGKKQHSGDTKTIRRLLLGAGTQFMQQFEGINIMSYYLPTVFIEYVGLSNQMARLLVGCNSVSYLVLSCAAVPLIEKWGRRRLMLISTFGQFVSFLVITILLRFSGNSSNGKTIATASIPFFFLFYIAFGWGMLGVPWLYPTEINSLPMRTKGAALATGTNWITNFVIVEITPIGIQNLGWKFWIVWTVFNAAFLPIIYFLYPETANRHLEDIDAYYRTNPSLIVTRDSDAISTKRPLKYIQHEAEEIRRNRTSISGSVVEDVARDIKPQGV
ncbi:general substrate transporter [Pleurostoma richardsiae]|uniref:General substrate transporter n=1 Tax=Pleurostoma richardsiae TaxID=41990 RepID=A0AA38S0U8_9PEZI|nr:general substrate transporter [Pleurostoma richardsiae]